MKIDYTDNISILFDDNAPVFYFSFITNMQHIQSIEIEQTESFSNLV